MTPEERAAIRRHDVMWDDPENVYYAKAAMKERRELLAEVDRLNELNVAALLDLREQAEDCAEAIRDLHHEHSREMNVTLVGGRIETPIIVACDFTVPADEIGIALMEQHLLDAHGIHLDRSRT